MTYLWAGYVITWLALAGYAWRLGRRTAEAEDHLLAARRRSRSTPDAG